MSNSATVLADDLGPRGRRLARLLSIAVGAGVPVLVGLAFQRLQETGQLKVELWEPFTDWSTIKFYGGGLLNTLKAASIAMLCAVVVGGVMALGRLAKNRPTRWLSGVYVEFFRAEPLLLLILFSAIVLPRQGIDLPIVAYLILGLALYNSAMLAEIFRAGILSLDRGQNEAAVSLGMSYWQSMLLVVIPQAARRMVPSALSQLVALLKDTSLGYVIAYEELLRRARISGEYFQNPLQSYVVVAVVYFLINFGLSRIAVRLERAPTRKAAALDNSALAVAPSAADLTYAVVVVDDEKRKQ